MTIAFTPYSRAASPSASCALQFPEAREARSHQACSQYGQGIRCRRRWSLRNLCTVSCIPTCGHFPVVEVMENPPCLWHSIFPLRTPFHRYHDINVATTAQRSSGPLCNFLRRVLSFPLHGSRTSKRLRKSGDIPALCVRVTHDLAPVFGHRESRSRPTRKGGERDLRSTSSISLLGGCVTTKLTGGRQGTQSGRVGCVAAALQASSG